LRGFRVLDPACGSGNFLYLALLALKDIELRAGLEAEALGLQRELLMGVGPEQVLGRELNPYAAELARVSVWIGHIQWAVRNGLAAPANPILRPLDTIECRDAVLTADGKPAPWPRADAIVSNPPFLGTKKQFGNLGLPYTRALRAAYKGRIPGFADLVCYWFERAREEVATGRTERVGLVGTNSIRGGANRVVLDRIARDATIFEAWSDEPWTVEGAAVHVSLVCFGREVQPPFRLGGQAVPRINPDLTSAAADLTTARNLAENVGVGFMGTVKGGKFEVPGDVARRWLVEPPNANGRPNADVLRPWVNTLDVVRRPLDRWIVDFGTTTSEETSAYYAKPFAHAKAVVKPFRDKVRRDTYRKRWWLQSEPCAGMRAALAPLAHYIATPTLSKHRVFVWLDGRIQPDHQLVAIARDDDATFGILHSRFHEAWALRLGTSLEDRPRYTPTTAFETFPFPEGLTPNVPAATRAADPRAVAIAEAARTLADARDRWLNPPDLVERVPEVVPGFPDRLVPRSEAAAKALKGRTLTNLYNARRTHEGAWLDALHRRLDAAVAAAYGWPADISEEDALAALLALNLARPAAKTGRTDEEP
jgi:type II restriction/modification system DNA methylase subunit YeeA